LRVTPEQRLSMIATVNETTASSALTVVDHPLVATKLAVIRASTTAPDEFRRNVQEVSALLLCEAARDWQVREVEIATPLKRCAGAVLAHAVVIVPILRAGLGMLDGMLRVLPQASVGHIGLYRDEETLRPVSYFCRLPLDVRDAEVLVLDPMLATGHSACEAVSMLKAQGATRIRFVCLVSCDAGIAQLQSVHPDVQIITAAVDPELNDFGYIVPGLGDAGDRYFGTG
jgi:uracil phosphoribosyltransferase